MTCDLNVYIYNLKWIVIFDLCLYTGSTTNIAKAFDLGLRMLSTDCPNRPTSQDLVIFITDGVANMDVDKTDLYVSVKVKGVHFSGIFYANGIDAVCIFSCE